VRLPAVGDNIVSNLPSFSQKDSKDFPGWLVVTCPYEGCGDKPFLVHKKTWLAKREVATPPSKKAQGVEFVTIRGRCCPYCHKVSLPKRAGRRSE
jgi:hypothetical protein